MITFNATSLRSRIARRIFAVFVLCALIPFAGLLFVSYRQVTAFFEEKNQRQLRALAKSFAMDTYERLLLLETALYLLATAVKDQKTPPTEDALDALPSHPKARWEAVTMVTADGRRYRLFGEPSDSFEPTATEKTRLRSGKALLFVRATAPNAGARIFIAVAAATGAEAPIVIGEVKQAYLWRMADTQVLPAYVTPCVFDASGTALLCAAPKLDTLKAALFSKSRRSAVGDLEWHRDGQNYQASYWTIPIKFQFQNAGWTFALVTSRTGIFASIAELQRVFWLWIIAAVGISVLLALSQIRKRLVPIEKLQEGTRRVAQKDFAFRVDIRSADEFQELAASLNAMAAQLGEQFEKLKAQAVQLEQANRVKDEFLGVMSHELRTPINVILGYTTMLQDRMLGEVNPEQANALATVAKRSAELLTMIESIMDATRIESGAVSVERADVDLASFLDELRSECSAPDGKDIELIWHCEPELPMLQTDPTKLKRICRNLIDNALKFTAQGRVTVSAAAERQSLVLRVADTGSGIDEAFLPFIFERFRQLDGSQTREHEGIGLGLYLVKKLTELLGGAVEVKSELGSGSVFAVRLPVSRSESVLSTSTAPLRATGEKRALG